MNSGKDDLNDRLDDIFGGAPSTTPPKTPPASYTKPEAYFDKCGKCAGTGQTRWGPCFRCKGKGGKAFKTSHADRAKGRLQAAQRKVRTAQERQAAFKAEHPDVAAWIDANQSFDFAVKMGEAVARFGGLTDGQMAACLRCIERDKQRKAGREARIASAATVDVSKIEQAFAKAREKADRPGARGVWMRPLRLKSGDHDLRFSLGSEGSQWAGMVFVKTADDRKLGSVKNGKFTRRFGCTDAEEAAIIDACSDPLKAAIAYGKAWSVCAVCGRELTNDGSIERGIGPICADKFGW